MLETYLLIAAWLITIVTLLIFVPKDKLREAYVIFLFKQLITWLFGLIVAEYRLIEYPVRIFKYASKTSFTFEFFVYPSICVIFNLYYPAQKSILRKFLHYFKYCTAITVIEVLIEKNTNNINYLNWTWYWTWITLYITFFFSWKFYEWFFRLKKKNA